MINPTCGTPTPDDLALIRGIAANDDLAADELFVFSLTLATDTVDRDGERFTAETLREFAPMFVGKTGIFDHDWSAHGQTARLFACETVEQNGVVELRGRAYMLREGNDTLVREIEAGIKREVSVGCAVKSRRCSVCGDTTGSCAHQPGRRYGGTLCVRELVGAADAYEWSFVAVPAQALAGVRKTFAQPPQPSRTGSPAQGDLAHAHTSAHTADTRPRTPQLVRPIERGDALTRPIERTAALDCYRI